jgi:hypothetical protein
MVMQTLRSFVFRKTENRGNYVPLGETQESQDQDRQPRRGYWETLERYRLSLALLVFGIVLLLDRIFGLWDRPKPPDAHLLQSQRMLPDCKSLTP